MARKSRDYAAERARRDAKYKALGYKSYNAYETQRRNTKAKAEGFRSYTDKRKKLRQTKQLSPSDEKLVASILGYEEYYTPGEHAMQRLMVYLERRGVDIEDIEQLRYTATEKEFWQLYRALYNRGISA